MNEIKFSTFMEYIMSYANERKEAAAATTIYVEHIYCAALYVISQNKTVSPVADLPFDNDEIKRVSELLLSRSANLEAALTELEKYAAADESPVSQRVLAKSKALISARKRAQINNLSIIGADMILQCILDSPTEGIKTHIIEGKPFVPTVTEPVPVKEAEPQEEGKDRIKSLINKTKRIRDRLLDRIFGQDNAVNVFSTGFFQSEMLAMTDKKRKRPRATFLFAGPPGVGKTFLAESAAEVLKLPFKRFDMSEYSDDEAVIEFCGSDKVYKNGKRGNVTQYVEENPHSVILFDEIEKAHLNVIHLFLQILDAGRLRDNYTDVEISFKDTILIFTTNAGRKLYEESETGNYSGLSRKVILKALASDKNPNTGESYFPGAICSRFASGNVVMFNHIEAHNLRTIAKKEVLRHADNLKAEFGIKSEFDEKVFPALLFAEGGSADARTVRARAEAFYDGELFELFRLIDFSKLSSGLSNLEKIRFTVALPENDPEISELFHGKSKAKVLVFAQESATSRWSIPEDVAEIITVSDIDTAEKLLKKGNIDFILCDVCFDAACDCKSLNIADIGSPGRDFFRHARYAAPDTPLYIFETKAHSFTEEEEFSYTKEGARDIIPLLDDDKFSQLVAELCGYIHQQRSMNKLSKANKVVSFETSQTLSDDGKVAEISLFDFELTVAVDPDDSKNILSDISRPDVVFDSIIGADSAKDELRYFANYLKDPDRFASTGVKVPRGILLYGPPGTGKTMLAKAMAGESDVTFINSEGNKFLKSHIGEGSAAVHDLFRTARKYAPSILFIDEIDAIAKERAGNNSGSEDTLTAFLAEMDGFKTDPSKPVFVLAATNFNVEPGTAKSLDSALCRRFDRKVYIGLPDKEARKTYLTRKLNSNAAFEISEQMIENIAIRSVGMSLAELESVYEFALRNAIISEKFKVNDRELDEAFEGFNGGDSKIWSEEQILRVARHEAGHTIVCRHSGEKPSYVTIVSRGNHGGYMQHGDNEGKGIFTKDELLAKIRTSLAGRAAEMVYYGEKDGISTGASGDLEYATMLATDMICSYGMTEGFGLAAISPTQELQSEVRSLINTILRTELEKAIHIIEDNTDATNALVAELVARNQLSGNEIEAIISPSFKKTTV